MIASAQGLITGKLILDNMIKSGICHICGYNIHHMPDIAKNCKRIFFSALQFKAQLCHRDLGQPLKVPEAHFLHFKMHIKKLLLLHFEEEVS